MAQAQNQPGEQVELRNRIKELRYVEAAELTAHPGNWRTHPAKQAAALAGVLREVGIADALIAYESKRNGGRLTLIDGHLRRESQPGARWPVLVLDVDDAEADYLLTTLDPLAAMAEASTAALDPLAAMAEASTAALNALLHNVQSGEAGVQTMLSDLAAQAGLYLDGDKGGDAPEPQIDKAEELRQKWGVEPGQLWRLGEHRLICGDCTDKATVERVMGGEQAACMWTDPPYGVSYVGKTKDALVIQNDGAADLPALLRASFNLAGTVLEPGAPWYVAHPAGALHRVFWDVVHEIGWQIHQELIWVKDSLVLGHSDYHFQHEPILYGYTPGPGRSGRGDHEGSRWCGDNAQVSVFQIPRPKRSEEHPTMKPPELVEAMLKNSTPRGGIVYEPYSGSGTTLVACESLGRKCRAVELSPAYVAVALQRWVDMTGQTPELVNDDART